MKKLTTLALAVVALAAITATPASANHAWGSYHWARTANPFTVDLGNNLTGAWATGGYLGLVSYDWSLSDVLDTRIVAGAHKNRCGAVAGRVEVCNDRYGRNGWLGLASIWTSGSHITQATVKVNDSYYAYAPYNSPQWRQSVLCQETGHTFGLDHQSEDPNVNMGTCMDYYKVPNLHPNAHDYEQLRIIYTHLDATTTLVRSASTTGGRGLRHVRDGLYVEDLGGTAKRFVFVTWTNPQAPHGPPADA